MEKSQESVTELTPEEREQIQRSHDEQTVFGLAVLMMEIHVGTQLRNKNQVANAFLKAGVMLQNNPGFPERFKNAQQAIIEQIKTQGRPPGVAKLTESSAPPPSEL